MGNSMYHYWKSQPEVLRQILEQRKSQTKEFVKLFCAVNPDKPVSYTHLDVYKRQGHAVVPGGKRSFLCRQVRSCHDDRSNGGPGK